MRYAVAVWNYVEPGVRLAELVREFVGFGCDTVAFSSGQFEESQAEEMRDVADFVRSAGLGATLHCAFDFGVEGVQQAIDLLGDRLLAVTFDPLSEVDSCGSSFATARMSPVLAEILRRTEGMPVRVGIEDLPLDRHALETYGDDLGRLLASERYGMLLDVGHLNLRRRCWAYFQGLSVEEYVTRIPVPIVEAHLHDNQGEADQHGHFGLGNIDFAAVAEALKGRGFDGVSTIEIAPSLHGSTPERSKPHAQASLARWRELLG